MTYRYRQVIEEGGGLTYLRHEFGLSPSELFVLDNLIKHDHPRHGCFPKQETIAHEIGLPLRTVKAALKRLADKGLIEREKLPYTDSRGRKRPGKIHHYRFADDVFYACILAWERFKSEREGALTEEIETELGRYRNGTNRADESVPAAPDRCKNSINRESEVIVAVPDRCKNGTHVGAKVAPVGRCRNGTRTGAETALEKLEVEVASKNGKRDSRSAAAGAAVERLSTDAVGSGNGEAAARGGSLYEQDKAAGQEEREAGAAPAHKGEPVPERKRCECGGEIPPEKADARDECRACYSARVRREEKERRAEEDEQRRLGFLEGRDRGRPERGLFSRGKTTGPPPAGGAGGGPLSDGEGDASGDG